MNRDRAMHFAHNYLVFSWVLHVCDFGVCVCYSFVWHIKVATQQIESRSVLDDEFHLNEKKKQRAVPLSVKP